MLAPRDSEFGLHYVVEHCTTRRGAGSNAADALTIKCHILWGMLDAIHYGVCLAGISCRRCGTTRDKLWMDADAHMAASRAPRGRGSKFDSVANQEMLLFPEAALLLNETGAEIVRLCDGARSIEQIIDSLADQFRGIDRDTLRIEAEKFLEAIRARGLLQ